MTSRLGAPLIALAMAAGTCLLLEQIARFAEIRLGAFLWRKDATLRLFAAHNYVGRGKERLLILGPSEARESLFPEEIGAIVTGLVPYQHAQHLGTLEEALVTLDYIERAYGPTAMPEALLVGITPRFIANIRQEPSPLYEAINRFSPHFEVRDESRAPRLAPRTMISAVRARAEVLRVQPDRYRRGVFAVVTAAAGTTAPSIPADRRVWGRVRQANYLQHRIISDEQIHWWLNNGDAAAVHAWDPERDRHTIVHQLARLRSYADRFRTRLYVVNLPEMSWNRELYDPQRYASYMSIVRTGIGDTPFLDLRMFIPDDEFYDSAHTMWSGGRRVSRRVGEFIEAQHGRVSHARASE